MARDDEIRPHLYLLRCWQEVGTHRAPDNGWRFSLEDPRDGGRRGFGSLAALTAALAAAVLADEGAGEVGQRGDNAPTD